MKKIGRTKGWRTMLLFVSVAEMGSGMVAKNDVTKTKPGKGYQFCHLRDELISNRWLVCTSFRTKDILLIKRTPRVVV